MGEKRTVGGEGALIMERGEGEREKSSVQGITLEKFFPQTIDWEKERD